MPKYDDPSNMGPIEQVCWAARDGRIDLVVKRSPYERRQIDAALYAGAIDNGGNLTETGEKYAEGVNRG